MTFRPVVRLGVLFFEGGGNRLHVCLGLVDRHPILQAAHDVEDDGAPVVQEIGRWVHLLVHLLGYPEFLHDTQTETFEAFLRDTDDGEHGTIHRKLATDDSGISAEAVSPASVAQDDDGMGSRCPVFLWEEKSS